MKPGGNGRRWATITDESADTAKSATIVLTREFRNVMPHLFFRIRFGNLWGSAPAVSPKYGVTQFRAVGKNHFTQAAGGVAVLGWVQRDRDDVAGR